MLIFLHVCDISSHSREYLSILIFERRKLRKINAEQGIMDYILQKEYDNMEKVLYQFNMLLDDVKALEREIQVLKDMGRRQAIRRVRLNAREAITPA